MECTIITTDKETYNGVLLYKERHSSFDDDFHVGNDFYDETFVLLTNNGIISINHYVNDIIFPVCDCDECKYLGEQEINCNPKTCIKCSGSSESYWTVKIIMSKEDITKFLK